MCRWKCGSPAREEKCWTEAISTRSTRTRTTRPASFTCTVPFSHTYRNAARSAATWPRNRAARTSGSRTARMLHSFGPFTRKSTAATCCGSTACAHRDSPVSGSMPAMNRANWSAASSRSTNCPSAPMPRHVTTACPCSDRYSSARE